ncbi:MAG: 5-(carboxyamino)imidazole ribonucleotide synthase [Candidatus Binatia bacterium]
MKPILPGAAIGVLGSGQLGRMFAIAARQMGYRVHTFSTETDTPTGQVADVEIAASYDDLDAVRRFAQAVQVVTFEFENVPAACVEAAAAFVPVRPGGSLLHIAQNRLREKSFLARNGFPTTEFAAVRGLDDLPAATKKIGFPAIMKTASSGYDGKGQAKVANLEDAAQAFHGCGGQEMIVEGFVDFELEFSVVMARGLDGQFVHWGAIQNRHKHHILDISFAPARMGQTASARAFEVSRALADKLDLIGVLCIEFFLTRNGEILVNELAPRPHNSGHLTINASRTSQFEQQLRAVCGLPLGSTEFVGAAAMANLLGDLWHGGEPNWPAACALPDVKLHLYGKIEPRPGRKMGHLTALAATGESAAQIVLLARENLQPVR